MFEDISYRYNDIEHYRLYSFGVIKGVLILK